MHAPRASLPSLDPCRSLTFRMVIPRGGSIYDVAAEADLPISAILKANPQIENPEKCVAPRGSPSLRARVRAIDVVPPFPTPLHELVTDMCHVNLLVAGALGVV